MNSTLSYSNLIQDAKHVSPLMQNVCTAVGSELKVLKEITTDVTRARLISATSDIFVYEFAAETVLCIADGTLACILVQRKQYDVIVIGIQRNTLTVSSKVKIPVTIERKYRLQTKKTLIWNALNSKVSKPLSKQSIAMKLLKINTTQPEICSMDIPRNVFPNLSQDDRGAVLDALHHSISIIWDIHEMDSMFANNLLQIYTNCSKNILILSSSNAKLDSIMKRLGDMRKSITLDQYGYPPYVRLDAIKYPDEYSLCMRKSKIERSLRDRLNAYKKHYKAVRSGCSGLNTDDLARSMEKLKSIQLKIRKTNENLENLDNNIIESAKVVAVTYATATLSGILNCEQFETVIALDSSTVSLPFILMAGAYARKNLVVCGDSCHYPPQPSSHLPLVKLTLGSDIMTYLDLTRRAGEGNAPSGVVLLHREHQRIGSQHSSANGSRELFGDGILYVHRGSIICLRGSHPVISVRAQLHTPHHDGAIINANYCTICHKCFISRQSYERYRERFGFLPIHFASVSEKGEYSFDGNTWATESPLMMCGYNVKSSNGFSSYDRQNILMAIVDNGIMTKSDVIRYLEQFIAINGSRPNMSNAVDCWRKDLDFVRGYRFNSQVKKNIYSIGPWQKSR